MAAAAMPLYNLGVTAINYIPANYIQVQTQTITGANNVELWQMYNVYGTATNTTTQSNYLNFQDIGTVAPIENQYFYWPQVTIGGTISQPFAPLMPEEIAAQQKAAEEKCKLREAANNERANCLIHC